MIKFIHKKHINNDIEKGKIIIYYNVSDIVLGIILLALVAFYMHDYLSHALRKSYGDCSYYPKVVDLQKNIINKK
jgi:hypothetical protein